VKTIAEAELHAYVDGALTESDRAEVEAWLVSHPEEAERLRAYAEQNALLRSFYNPVLEEPVPAELLAARPREWRRYAAAAGISRSG
jgi:anti-sigma factor RsiW